MNTKRIASIWVFVSGLLIATPAPAQVAISEDGVVFPDGTVMTTGTTSYGYEIGAIGPAGGIVFYLEPDTDGLHGLEAAPVNQSEGVEWGCYGTDLLGANGTEVGTGKQNTIDIYTGCSERPIAASVAGANAGPLPWITPGWFLPSKEELALMYQNLHNQTPPIGGFSSAVYWSSSESNTSPSGYAWYRSFQSGFQSTSVKLNTFRVRAVRSF